MIRRIMTPQRIVLVAGALVRSGGGWRVEWRGEGVRARSRTFLDRAEAASYLTTALGAEGA